MDANLYSNQIRADQNMSFSAPRFDRQQTASSRKTLALVLQPSEWKRPPEYPGGLFCPTLGYPARGPVSWHRRSDVAIT
jgi:hypothetical protein